MERLLIAERGEAAVRVARTAKRLGLTTIALRHPTDDAGALHLEACDEAQPAPEDMAALPEVVRQCGADAVHPGYAQRSVLPVLAALAEAGIPTVGASPEAWHRCADEDAVAAAAESIDLRPTPAEGLDRPRRLDLMVAADRQGSVAPLGEMELLVRPDGPPLLVESPAPALIMRHDGEAAREAMGEGAARLVVALGVTGLATVHYLFDMEGRLWVAGVTPGIPTLHAPLELVGGLDLLEVDLQIMNGEALQASLFTLQPHGHAFAVRVETDAPLDQPVTEHRWPPAPHGRLRVDPCIQQGAVPEDALLLKIATVSPIRHQALLTLDRVLAATTVTPYATNAPALREVIGDEGFRASQYDVGFMTRTAEAP
jgi:acetyl-CoA/propionyl-CoA carboxylase, biotin carboxylase, biotin carboxyl carrier protein